MKNFLEYVLMGAGTAIGYIGVTKAISIAQDPVKKAAFKKKLKNIKAELTKNED